MNLRKYVVASVVVPTLAMSAVAQQPTGAQPLSTGIIACDVYLNQVEACMKTQIPANEYAELEEGLAQARQTFSEATDKEAMARQCTQALQAVKAEYTNKGCTFGQ